MTNQVNEIKEIIREIIDKIPTGLPIKPYPQDPNQTNLGFKRIIVDSHEKLMKFCHEFDIFNNFIDYVILENILLSLRKILQQINHLIELPITAIDEEQIQGRELINEINKLPVIYNLTFYNTGNINIPAIKNLFLYFPKELQLFNDLNIDFILSEANYSELNNILQNILDIHNTYIATPDSPYITKLILDTYKVLNAVLDKSKKIESENSIEELQAQAVGIKEKFGLVSNDKLIEAFKKEALSYEKDIKDHNHLILTIFSLIIFSLIILVILVTFTDFLHEIKFVQFYGFYISLFIFLSAFLTYITRERKRLLRNQHYSNISHLELLALPLYVAQISDDAKKDDLMIHLSNRYFLGPNPPSNNEDATTNITIDKLNECIKLAQEVKSTIKN